MSTAQQVRFGNTGLKISPIVVGCMSFGSKDWADWLIEDKEEVFKILKRAYDRGLRTFDTADVYSNGLSERLLGEFLRRYNINRETVVILTKVFFPTDENIRITSKFNFSDEELLALSNQRGLSRKHILAGVKAATERLGTYIDVLQIHRLDPETPMEEIMRSLNDVVLQGDVRYIGASSMLATEFAELNFIAERHDWFQFVSSQSYYSLLYREDERELMPFAKRHGIALIPWSPLSGGVLTRPLGESSDRYRTDNFKGVLGIDNLKEHEKEIVNRLEKVARDHGHSMAAVATAWVLHKGCNPIIGLNSVKRVDQALDALEVKLSEKEINYLEEPYLPRNVLM
ncbi:aryl-alcohol dehydrogenase [Zygosaccharomyces mellis]|uniref:Aryl-alcohol dehydrogenase n=1 Tax=Zygosaccharomyces mellis TaxID=42258 RepID=A0A4C2E7B5_9SACH|nr:aryl-alcohol dehydrogenase [Zygosaccharomyces mellis]